MAEIQLNHVYKKFEDGVTAVKNFTLDIHDRDLWCSWDLPGVGNPQHCV